MFAAIGHDVNARDARHLAQLADQFDADAAAFLAGVACGLHPGDDVVGDMDARHVAAHPARRLGRGQRSDPGKDIDLALQPQIADPRHEGLKPRHVEDIVGLDELGPRLDLFGQPLGAPFQRIDAGVLGGADEQPGRAGDLAARQEHALVAHGADGADQRQRVEIKDRFRAGLVARADIIAGQAQDIADPHRGGPQHIALNGDAVPVAARDLIDRAMSRPGQQRADPDG